MVKATLHGRSWFAWYPVRLGFMNNGQIVWLQRLMRYRAGDIWVYQRMG